MFLHLHLNHFLKMKVIIITWDNIKVLWSFRGWQAVLQTWLHMPPMRVMVRMLEPYARKDVPLQAVCFIHNSRKNVA